MDGAFGDGFPVADDRRIRRSQRENSCTPVMTPENAFLTGASPGSGWECDRGYRAAGEGCGSVVVPENGHLDYSGNDWECDAPYKERGDKCVRVL